MPLIDVHAHLIPPFYREALIAELWDELGAAPDEEAERLTIRRFRRREMLRIGYDDIVRGMPLEVTALDLSYLADACLEAACRLAVYLHGLAGDLADAERE